MPLISVITPFSRGMRVLPQLIRDFRNQTFQNFEHIIVNDGPVQDNVKDFIKDNQNDYNIRFVSIEKDFGDMWRSPGTKARNYGTSLAKGTYVYYADDDNRYKDVLIETLLNGMTENRLSVVQVACVESRVFKNGSPTKIAIVPEIGLPFPLICHVDTASCLFPRRWILEDPWRYEPEHDFRLIKRIIEKHHPEIVIHNGVQVDLDGIFVKGIRDFVSIPPFFRK